jgi:hypothetical protein
MTPDRCERPAGASLAAVLIAVGVAAGGCGGVKVKRHLATVPPSQVIYGDMCGLQQYFDVLESGKEQPPATAAINDTETDGLEANGGKIIFAFQGPFQLATLRRVLEQNWTKLPPALAAAHRVEIEVYWARKAGVQRAATTHDAVMKLGAQNHYLPYHHCLSDLLFGSPLYRTRRELIASDSATAPPPPTTP